MNSAMRLTARNLVAGLLVLGAATPAWSADAPKAPAKNASIPDSFQVWMVTGKYAGRYHSPVTEHGLNPVVLVFVRDLEGADKPLFDLLKKLDDIILKHRDVRLGVCAVFLNDAGLREALGRSGEEYVKKFGETSPAKQDLESQVSGTAKQKGIAKVEFALDTSAGPLAYRIDDKAQITVIFYQDHTILDREAFAKDQFSEAHVQKLVGEVEQTVTGLEKRMPRRR
jgi:hypothetical protein